MRLIYLANIDACVLYVGNYVETFSATTRQQKMDASNCFRVTTETRARCDGGKLIPIKRQALAANGQGPMVAMRHADTSTF